MYKLFIGFKKLGEFKSIIAAKKYAQNYGKGCYSLYRKWYSDAWYQFE